VKLKAWDDCKWLRSTLIDLDPHDASERSTCTKRRGERSARTITVNGVRQKYAGADNAKERGDCFQHDNNP
jgi:hypothetical protein